MDYVKDKAKKVSRDDKRMVKYDAPTPNTDINGDKLRKYILSLNVDLVTM
jgi:hypothetical protein